MFEYLKTIYKKIIFVVSLAKSICDHFIYSSLIFIPILVNLIMNKFPTTIYKNVQVIQPQKSEQFSNITIYFEGYSLKKEVRLK